MVQFGMIAAMDENQGIGIKNQLPWHLPGDYRHFVETTSDGTVIMGRKTWESLPDKYRPLPNRLNIVLSSQSNYDLPEGVLLAHSLDDALEKAEGKTFVIGGAKLYAEAITHPNCQTLVLTEIYDQFDCDAFFPLVPSFYKVTQAGEEIEENGIHYRIFTYEREQAQQD